MAIRDMEDGELAKGKESKGFGEGSDVQVEAHGGRNKLREKKIVQFTVWKEGPSTAWKTLHSV